MPIEMKVSNMNAPTMVSFSPSTAIAGPKLCACPLKSSKLVSKNRQVKSERNWNWILKVVDSFQVGNIRVHMREVQRENI